MSGRCDTTLAGIFQDLYVDQELLLLHGGFKCFLLLPLAREVIQFDEHFFRWVETNQMKSLDVSVEHLTLVRIICVCMLPFFVAGIFEGYSPQITTKNDISRKPPRVDARRSSAKNIPRINQ